MKFDILVENIIKAKGSLLLMAEEIYRRVREKQLKAVVAIDLLEDLERYITDLDDKKSIKTIIINIKRMM